VADTRLALRSPSRRRAGCHKRYAALELCAHLPSRHASQPKTTRRRLRPYIATLSSTCVPLTTRTRNSRRREPDAVSVPPLLNAQTFYARHGFTKVGESELFAGSVKFPSEWFVCDIRAMQLARSYAASAPSQIVFGKLCCGAWSRLVARQLEGRGGRDRGTSTHKARSSRLSCRNG
jgi:hypothetical protein